MLPALQPAPCAGRIHIERTCVLAETRRRKRRSAVTGKGPLGKTVKVSSLSVLFLAPYRLTLCLTGQTWKMFDPTSRVGGRVESPEAIFRKRLPSVFSAFCVHRWDWIQVASMLLRARPTLVQLSFFYSRCYFTVYKRVAQNERVNIRSKGGVNRVEIVLPLKFYPCSFPGQSSGSGKTPLLSFLGLRLRSSILTRANGTTNASFDAKLPLSTATASSPEGLSSQPDARSAMERR